MPGPLTLWVASILFAVIGAGRNRARPAPGSTTPGARIGRLMGRVPVVQAFADLGDTPMLRANMSAAGHSDLSATDIAHARAVGLHVGAACAAGLVLLNAVAAFLGVALAAWGYFMPALWVAGRARRRRAAIVGDLPDMIDVVVLCTAAGMALEPALRLTSERLTGPCADEVAITLREMDLGAVRRDAYRGMADRVGIPQMRGLVGALIQAEELGSPINDALTRQAEILRSGRRQAVRDAAARTAPKVQLVVAMVMVPGALLVVVGVMVLQLVGQLGAVTGGMP
jgi:tight adherence protein C